jgi:hypothetical protein
MEGVFMTTNRRVMTSAEMQEEVLEKIAQFSDKNKSTATRLHALIMETAPSLHARLWYGMPGYAKTKDSALLVFFREDDAYMTFGFTESVSIDINENGETPLTPCAWFFTELDESAEQKIAGAIRSVVR